MCIRSRFFSGFFSGHSEFGKQWSDIVETKLELPFTGKNCGPEANTNALK